MFAELQSPPEESRWVLTQGCGWVLELGLDRCIKFLQAEVGTYTRACSALEMGHSEGQDGGT